MSDGLEVRTVSDIVAEVKERASKVKLQNMSHGNWKMDWDNLQLLYKSGQYSVDLERCTTSASILDWIFHLKIKGWFDRDDLWSLVALLKVLIDPCSKVCTGGQERGPYKFWEDLDFDGIAERYAYIDGE